MSDTPQDRAERLARKMAEQARRWLDNFESNAIADMRVYALLLIQAEEATERAQHCHCTDGRDEDTQGCEDCAFVRATLSRLKEAIG